MATEGLKVLQEIFRNPQVVDHLANAPEAWLWSLLNSVVSAVPFPKLQLVPPTIVTIVTALFAILNPGYIEEHFKGPEFYATPRSHLRAQYDYVIVGGGTAGCLLANRLSAKSSVLLIEGGSTTNILNHVPLLNAVNFREPSLGLDWMYNSVEQKFAFQRVRDRRAHMGGGKGIGGSSHINFQIYSRGWDENYDRWERVYGATGWNSSEMLHYMKLHENVHNEPRLKEDRHGNDGELSVMISPLGERRQPLIEAWLEAGARVTSSAVVDDHNGNQGVGFSVIQTTIDPLKGSSSHSGRAFIDPIREERKERLHILLNSMVEKVLLDGNQVATGVEVLTPSIDGEAGSPAQKRERITIKAAGEVILSAGSARSPQILMLSGIGPREELETHGIPVKVDLPSVGANLHDHVLSFGQAVSFKSRKNERPGKGWFDMELGELHKFFANRTGMFMSACGVLGLSFIHSPISDDRKLPDIEMIAVDMSLGAPMSNGAMFKFGVRPEDMSLFTRGTGAHGNQNGFIVSSVLERGKSRGKVRLQSHSIEDHPIMDLQYLSDPHDVDVLVEAFKYTKESIAPLAKFGAEYALTRAPGCDSGDLDSDEYLRCHVKSYTMSLWHMAGTCRMGASDDPSSVVDPELRVRGVRNLRVVDASVIPEETSGHMVATVYGIAEKAAHMILNRKTPKEEL
ncbi:uncharacterized protein LOC100900525 [Galendromus occidentalis]|uniref:Uncharacterized protein LOC100900525 n=1 Tax=Galendromus occidentalis TaxID=34638 RepID=A0AAJ6QNL2_9ACAR|nr:uncharacterized protein LOC100900525 [Galendromus occidentalis]